MEQKILAISERLFLEKGFSMTSTTEIAKEAGCNQALVHYYFRTKDKLFDEVFQKKIAVFIGSFTRISEENISFEKKLRLKIESHFDMLLANQQLPFLFLNEIITNPSRIAGIREKFGTLSAQVFSQFGEELSAEIRKGTIRPVQPIDLILSVFSLNIGTFLIKPVIKELLGMNEAAFCDFAQKRKEENCTTILNSLKP
jgi:AcrR family transcriptional regulator